MAAEPIRHLKNAWYVAALSSEVGAEGMFSRTVLGTPLLLYRRQNGEPVALHDQCPHRFVPLHMGKKVGDDVVCPYHALRFAPTGECVHNPHGEGLIPKAAKVQCFQLAERHGFIWIWAGEAAKADLSLIPDYGLLDAGHENSKGYGYMRMEAHYEIVVDNIMDLSHVDHVHGPLLNTAGHLSAQQPKVQESPRSVNVRWDWNQDPPMGFFSPFLKRPGEGARHHVTVAWTAPSNMLLTVGAVQDSPNEEDGLISWDFHLLTPETETTTHYFFATRRNWGVEDAELNRMKLEGTIAAFTHEDKPIIEAVQKRMRTSDLWSLKPVLLSSDPAAVRARRTLAQLIEREIR